MKQAEIEKKILDFWEKDNTFQKSIEKDAPHGDYVFYDGPPFATGTPHYGHIVASLMKDMVPRYFTMRGFRVERRWGWDCHGLPIENIVEKEKGFKHKKDIIEYGVDKFNEDARSKVLKYADEWQTVIERMGRWVDFSAQGGPDLGGDSGYGKGAYLTMDVEYMESIWHVFKELYDKDLLYEAYRSMHICPRCETTLAQSEVAQGYKDVKDLSVIAKFELEDEPGTFLLAWTTTPWTLPGNMALAVGEDIDYARIVCDKAIYIAAKDHVQDIFKDKEYEQKEDVPARDLIGKKYKPLFPYYDNENLENHKNAFKVYSADFVNTEEGTGIVHIAPAFGEDDYNLSKKENLPFVQHVNMDGTFKSEVTDFAGKEVKPKDDSTATDVEIIKYLAKKDLLFSKEKFEHSYPHCWRCESPLLNYSASSWFVKVEKIKKDLLKNAKKINWMPEHIKEGRFGQWLSGARDWSISRQRFWGSVMPIWVCEKNKDHKKVIGSIKELEDLSGYKVEDLHKHFVDEVAFKCKECEGEMRRIPDVLDCWFESGSMPFAQLHYPFENKKKFKNNFPAEFIAEGVDQTRAWFYYMHVLATALKKKPAFQNVIVNGIVLAEDGRKMSKSLNNYPDPMEIIEKYGADAVRYYLASSTVMRAEDLNFSEKGVDEVVKKVILTLYNVLAFYKMYAPDEVSADDKSKNILDKWIISKTNELISEVTDAYDKYDLNRATRPIMEFINELSTWYIRRSRDRFKGEDQDDKNFALSTLRFVLERLSLVMAPVIPFTAEHLWQELGNKESVHLQEWPAFAKASAGKPKAGKVDKDVLEKMQNVLQIVELGLAARAEAGIKIRQPLGMAKVFNKELSDDYASLIKDELNVKQVAFVKGENKIELDTKITDELRIEGNLRELVRTINAMRKKQGLTPGDVVVLKYKTDSDELKKVFDQFEDELKKSVIASELVDGDIDGEKVDINGENINIEIGI
ncbi:isoleucine--tRNA ligase [Patescibacteria group bacterium]|nr:isoleucine--tRNA ligase [Patescibacteria group bacterium]